MAFDQQRNWDIQMADNLEKVKLGHDSQYSLKESNAASILATEPKGPPIFLPDEIIALVVDYLSETPSSQKDLAACCLLSNQWYRAAVPLLYGRPYLYGNNFDPFVKAICPSINLHVRKSPLSELVKVLDMGKLVHHGSKSLTARILGRVKGNLEKFVAPQASFAVNCFPALGKCSKLRFLDLSLVSESPPLPELFKTVLNLHELKTFKLPRSAGFGVHHAASEFGEFWPPKLENLTLSGGIDGHFLYGVVQFPSTLTSLTIEHCPQVKSHAILSFLTNAVQPLQTLKSLKVANMPRLSQSALDEVLFILPGLSKLSVSVDYITPAMFEDTHFHCQRKRKSRRQSIGPGWPSDIDLHDESSHVCDQSCTLMEHHLRSLELTNSGNLGVEDKITPLDIIIAIDEGFLPSLREVRVAKSLLWAARSDDEASSLADSLHESSKKDWEKREGVFETMSAEEYNQDAVWEEHAGVWQFDG